VGPGGHRAANFYVGSDQNFVATDQWAQGVTGRPTRREGQGGEESQWRPNSLAGRPRGLAAWPPLGELPPRPSRCSSPTALYDEDITSMDTTSPIRWRWSSTCFRTTGKHLFATVVTASYGFQFGCSTTPWKDHQVYFETDPSSCGYLIRVGHNQ
jgi:hypothetical protein